MVCSGSISVMSEITVYSEESFIVIVCDCVGTADRPLTSSASVDTSGDTVDQTDQTKDHTSLFQRSSSTMSEYTGVTSIDVTSVQNVSVSRASNPVYTTSQKR